MSFLTGMLIGVCTLFGVWLFIILGVPWWGFVIVALIVIILLLLVLISSIDVWPI